MTSPIHVQLQVARGLRGLTLQSLVRKARLSCTPQSLSRKLAGKQDLTADEIQHLCRALQVRVLKVA